MFFNGQSNQPLPLIPLLLLPLLLVLVCRQLANFHHQWGEVSLNLVFTASKSELQHIYTPINRVSIIKMCYRYAFAYQTLKWWWMLNSSTEQGDHGRLDWPAMDGVWSKHFNGFSSGKVAATVIGDIKFKHINTVTKQFLANHDNDTTHTTAYASTRTRCWCTMAKCLNGLS